MRKIIEGSVIPTESQDLKILMVTLVVERDGTVLNLNYKISERPEDTLSRRKWLTVNSSGIKYIYIFLNIMNIFLMNEFLGTLLKPRFTFLDGYGEQSMVRVIRRQPNLSVLVKHMPPGLLDELYPILLEVVNEEPYEIEANVNVEFKSSVIISESSGNYALILNN